jgi:4a-hydroxytetrahydrobiopterin dehydratase
MIDGALEKSFKFADFHQTMAFVNAVAFIAHRQDHHPDVQLSYGRCTVRWQTHDVAALSASDFLCAAKVDALLD